MCHLAIGIFGGPVKCFCGLALMTINCWQNIKKMNVHIHTDTHTGIYICIYCHRYQY